jgi:polyhydroxyalkanoate synthase subunit PhaE
MRRRREDVGKLVLFDRVCNNSREVLGNVLNPAMTYRLYQQKLIEVFLNIYDLPTRSKLDEIHRRLDKRCKEVKSLKKSLVDS